MALFSKKHYHALRDAMRKSVHGYGHGVMSSEMLLFDMVSSIADMLVEDNPAFERQRFMTEIYVPEASSDH